MSMRISSAALAALLLLTGCKIRHETDEPAAGATVAADDPDAIECALAGAPVFERVCKIERSKTDEGLLLVVRHPDGGFRRFEVLEDGRGLAAADGAEDAELTIGGGILEAKVGDDRYRFPATIGAAGAAR